VVSSPVTLCDQARVNRGRDPDRDDGDTIRCHGGASRHDRGIGRPGRDTPSHAGSNDHRGLGHGRGPTNHVAARTVVHNDPGRDPGHGRDPLPARPLSLPETCRPSERLLRSI
jgi:hypothetical protein